MKLIFIHGSGACGDIWYYQKKHFGNADAPDLPGHPVGKLPGSIEEYSDWLHSYIQSTKDNNIVLVGHSLGGGIVLMHALKYPQDLKAIITIGSGARLRVRQDILDYLRSQIGDTKAWMRDFVEPSYNIADEQVSNMLFGRLEAVGPAAQLHDLLCCDKFDIMTRLGQITLPALAIVGDEDNMTLPKYSKYLSDNIPNCKIDIIENAGHNVYIDKPGQVNQSIERFLQQSGI